MRLEYTNEFKHEYQKLPTEIQKQLNKGLKLFLDNPHHPSLNTKKLKGFENIWQGRINQVYRFTFMQKGDVYFLLHIFHHK